jgi:hypothetical protein
MRLWQNGTVASGETRLPWIRGEFSMFDLRVGVA